MCRVARSAHKNASTPTRIFNTNCDRIAEYKKAQADKTVSLNEAERLAEKKAQQAKDDARTKEISSRRKPNEKVYELTQENVNLSTLQPPKTKDCRHCASSSSAATAELALSDEDAPDVGEEAVANEAKLREAKNILIDYIAPVEQVRLCRATALRLRR